MSGRSTPDRVLSRPRVDAALCVAWERRVVLVDAGPGYGKSTALAALAGTGPGHLVQLGVADRHAEDLVRRLRRALGVADSVPADAVLGVDDPVARGEAQAMQLCAAVEGRADELLIVDEVERVAADPGAVAFLRALCLQAPDGLHVVLSGRAIPGLGVGEAAGRGELARVGAAELAFTPEEVAGLATHRLGAADAALVAAIAQRTAGWPAAVCLLLDALGRAATGHDRIDAAGWLGDASTAWRDFADAIVAGLPGRAQELLTAAAVAGVAEVPLLRALDIDVSPVTIDELVERGLLVRDSARDAARVCDVVVPALLEGAAPRQLATWRDHAAEWFEQQRRLVAALDCRAAGSAEGMRAFLGRCGHDLIAAGAGRRVADCVRDLRGDDDGSAALLGAALWACGDWDGAAEAFGRLRAGAGAAGMPGATAWQFGALLYLRGEVDTAVEVLAGARQDESADGALTAAWLASALWSRGDLEDAATAAQRADAAAVRSRDPRARSAAQVAIALVAASHGDRDRNAQAYRTALAAAVEAGDTLQTARIHANLASKAIEEGDYPLALVHADQAMGVGAGHRFFTALASTNKAEALLRLGELDAARDAGAQASAAYRALGSLSEATALLQLAQIHQQRGEAVPARLAFERAARTAEAGGDVHAVAAALTGLAWLLAATEPAVALEHARAAVARASGLERAAALAAQGWAELNCGDPAADETARAAETQARATGDRPALIAALQVRALAHDPPEAVLLEESLALCEQIGDPIATIRARQAIAACGGDDAEIDAQRRLLLDRGAAEIGVAALLVRRREGTAGAVPAITTLGTFTVTVAGRPVAANAWQSRKARDLLKILIAGEGRPVPREAAAETLWPEQAPDRVANRLSVALSTVRRVLDPDRSQPADHYVSADARAFTLRTDRIHLDLPRFFAAVEAAAAAAEAGDWTLADRRCADAELLYRGEFLEEDRYEDWALNCRERARLAAATTLRLRARAARLRGNPEAAVTYLLRLVERDPYDEQSWLALIALQRQLRRHGEARRLFNSYSRRMAELDIAPTPFSRVAAAP